MIVSKKECYKIFLKCLKNSNSSRYVHLCSTHATSAQILCLFLKLPHYDKLEYVKKHNKEIHFCAILRGCLKKKTTFDGRLPLMEDNF